MVGLGVRVGYLALPYHTILLQILTNQHTFTYQPTYLNICPTLHYHTLTYPILSLPYSDPTPTQQILKSLTKHIPYPTLPNPSLRCTAVPWPAPPHPAPRPPHLVSLSVNRNSSANSVNHRFTELAEEFRMPFRYFIAPISILSGPKISRLSDQSLQIVWTR